MPDGVVLMVECAAVTVQQRCLVLADCVQVNSRIANLNHLVQIRKGLMLVHLCHPELLNQQLLNVFQLLDL
jgi:hypothetical protein